MSTTKKVTCPCGCKFSFAPPAVTRRRKGLLLTDDECCAAYAALPPQESYLDIYARFGPWTGVMQPSYICAWCSAPISKYRAENHGHTCADCADNIESKRDAWQAVNNQEMSYDEAVALKTAHAA